jgi:hypothetical protein
MKINVITFLFIGALSINAMAQTEKTETLSEVKTEEKVGTNPKTPTLDESYQDFKTMAMHRVVDNEKSLATLNTMRGIFDPQELAFYKEKVAIFEKRNNEMKTKISDFDVKTSNEKQLIEFKKRWNWAMDELSVYEKNLMTENFLKK